MDGKPLSVCPVCASYPCKCKVGVELELVRLTYKVGSDRFVVWIPKVLVDQYKILYE